jgi:neutral ceramidase
MDTPQSYLVGIARCDITPPVGIRLCGFAARTEPSTGIYDPLQAVATVVDDGKNAVLIVAADLLGFYDRCEPVRQALAQILPIPASHIVLAGSHTHCGPHIREFDRCRLGPPDPAYLALLTDRIVAAARTAWETRSEARLQFGNGHCGFAVSRRRLRPDGLVEWGPDESGPHDHGVPVLTASSPAGELTGILYNYACHPTSRAGLLVGGDYVGLTHDRLATHFPGVPVGFLQGCGADLKPRPVDPAATTFVAREVEEVQWLGDELGDAVAKVIQSSEMRQVRGPLTVRSRTIQLETVAPDVAVAKRVLANNERLLGTWAEKVLRADANGTELDRSASFEIQTVAFGESLAMVTLAGEITVEHGLRLKRELGAAFAGVLVVGYANHLAGYIPVKRQIPEGGYCVEWANRFQGRPGRWVDETEEQIHRTIHEMLGI